MMNKQFFLIGLLLITFTAIAQESAFYRVYFKDKGSNRELISQPHLFLSEAALNRRALQGIGLDNSDLPVAPEYKKTLRQIGAIPLAQSKWLNYVYVEYGSKSMLESLPFVKKVVEPKTYKGLLCGGVQSDTLDYGLGRPQIEMLRGDLLHQRGFTGTGITIAVIDAGYAGFHQIHAFDSLRVSSRLLGTYNFISGDTNVFSGWGDHGTSVFSIMAANSPDTFVGTAPDANYWLFTTENTYQESPIEMDHWLMAAEFADSVGAHVINSSLSYRTFDDSAYNYAYADMDGNTTVITQAADWAASKGILVVTGAGNDAGSIEPHIGAPADGDSVLAVGAVNWDGHYASLSSIGPSFDGRVKPDVMAAGFPTSLYDGQGNLILDVGTSYAAPLIAGLGACLIEAYPAQDGATIANFIRASSSQYTNPTDTLGYGVPNFDYAYQLSAPSFLVQNKSHHIYPNPVRDYLVIDALNEKNWQVEIFIIDAQGREVYKNDIQTYDAFRLQLQLEPGIYSLVLRGDLNGSHLFQVYQ